MVWYDNIDKACSDTKLLGKNLLVFLSDESEESQTLNTFLHNDEISAILECCACIEIPITSEEFQQFTCEYPSDTSPKVVIIDSSGIYIGSVPASEPDLKSSICKILKIDDSYHFVPKTSNSISFEQHAITPEQISEKVRIKFEQSNSNFWSHDFESSLVFSEIRKHVSENIDRPIDRFKLYRKYPKLLLSSEHDSLTLDQLSFHPSIVIFIEDVNKPVKSNSNYIPSFISSFVSFITSSLYSLIGLLFSDSEPVTQVPESTQNQSKPENSASQDTNVRRRNTGKEKEFDDDKEKRLTDNGNNTSLI